MHCILHIDRYDDRKIERKKRWMREIERTREKNRNMNK